MRFGRLFRGENVTIFACFNAGGTYVPTMITFKGSDEVRTFKST
jgi:hypothetical protein